MFSTPTVAGELLFIGSCAGKFYAINKATGQVQWSYDIRKDGKQQSFHGDPLVTNELILIGTDYSCAPDGVGHVYAFERDSGTVRWKYRSTSVPTDIVQLNSSVYFGSFQDKWSSVDLHKGGLNWSFATGALNKDCDAIKAPVANANRLFIVGLDGLIYSLDASSGLVSWKRKLPAAPSTALALRDKTIYVGTNDRRIYRLNAETGTIISELATDAKPVGRLAFANDSLFMFLENASERVGYIVSVDSKLAGVRWKQRSSPDWASERPHLWKESVVAGNCRGGMVAFRATDGEPQWNLSLKGCIRSIGSTGNMLFAGVQEGTIYAYELPTRP
ncbi:MAG: PQQ-like beta-propeller repeat protein [Pyrinomonadaceae bacterium]|nr:PQQ-like beta-propeller repeat protein [Pyrinomonadaceae bacterium]